MSRVVKYIPRAQQVEIFHNTEPKIILVSLHPSSYSGITTTRSVHFGAFCIVCHCVW